MAPIDLLFEDGEMVKVQSSFQPKHGSWGDMEWKPGVVVGTIDFGYEVLCEGKVIEVHAMDLEKLTEVNDDER